MMKRLLALLMCMGLVVSGAVVTGCQPDTPKEHMEEAQEDMEDAAEEVGDAIEEAGEDVEDAMDQ
jgi:hypothetical protein